MQDSFHFNENIILQYLQHRCMLILKNRALQNKLVVTC